MTRELVFRVLFPFGGAGLGARGFLDAEARLPSFGVSARFECVGGVDLDPLGCADFEYLTGAPELCAPVETLTVADVIRHFGPRAPDCVFMSPPCKGASGLLSEEKSQTEKYARMNELALVWTRLMLGAWGDDPPPLVLLENVPRLKTRAAKMLRAIRKLLRGAGYVFKDGFHDCGELGGLAQRRRRYLLVARHPGKCPPLLHHTLPKRVRGCGEVLSQLPVPGTIEARTFGKMHELPKLSWLNWVRLSLIPAGGDWRDLEGVLAEGQERRAVFKRHAVEAWDEPTGTVGGSGSNGVANVADPRIDWYRGALGVLPWEEPAATVTGRGSPSCGRFTVADPRFTFSENAHRNKYAVRGWDAPASTVIGATRPGSGAPGVADPRVSVAFDAGYAVLRWEDPARTIAGGSAVGQGAYSVADIRVGSQPRAGAYGVLRWDEHAKTITGYLQHDNGAAAVADPRKPPPFIPVIVAADDTWHRPLTTLELAALQGFPLMVRGEPLKLAGTSHSKWRERIGNAVPAPAARAIAEEMLVTLASGSLGIWTLSNNPVWVGPEALHG